MLCHTEKIAPGTVAIASVLKEEAARLVAKPEFCIPTSTHKALVFAALSLRSLPTPNPQA